MSSFIIKKCQQEQTEVLEHSAICLPWCKFLWLKSFCSWTKLWNQDAFFNWFLVSVDYSLWDISGSYYRHSMSHSPETSHEKLLTANTQDPMDKKVSGWITAMWRNVGVPADWETLMSSFSYVSLAALQQGIKPIQLNHFYLCDFMDVKQGVSLIHRKLDEIRSELLTWAS